MLLLFFTEGSQCAFMNPQDKGHMSQVFGYIVLYVQSTVQGPQEHFEKLWYEVCTLVRIYEEHFNTFLDFPL